MEKKFHEKTTKAALARTITEASKKFKAEGHNHIRIVFFEKIDKPVVRSVFVTWLDENGIASGSLSPKGDRLKVNLLKEFNDPEAKWFEITVHN